MATLFCRHVAEMVADLNDDSYSQGWSDYTLQVKAQGDRDVTYYESKIIGTLWQTLTVNIFAKNNQNTLNKRLEKKHRTNKWSW